MVQLDNQVLAQTLAKVSFAWEIHSIARWLLAITDWFSSQDFLIECAYYTWPLSVEVPADQGITMMHRLRMIAPILVIPLRMSDQYHIYLLGWIISGTKDFQCPPSVGKSFHPLASHPDLETLTGAETYTAFLWSFRISLRDPGTVFSLYFANVTNCSQPSNIKLVEPSICIHSVWDSLPCKLHGT